MKEERNTILRMLNEGKISLDEAQALLDALDESAATEGARTGGQGKRPGAGEAGGSGSKERLEFRFDIGDVGKEISDTVGEMLKGVKETLSRGLNVGEWFDSTLGAARSEDTRVISFPVEGIEALAVRNIRGNIKLRGTEQSQINVRARITVWAPDEEKGAQAASRVEFTDTVEGGKRSIEARFPKDTEARRFRVDYEVEMPPSIISELSSVSGNITVDDVRGRASLESLSGNLSAQDLEGGADLKSASGDIRVARGAGEFSQKTLSGDVVLSQVTGRAVVECKSGDIRITNARADLSAESLSGDIGIRGFSGELKVSTKSGSIHVAEATGPALEGRSVSGGMNIETTLVSDGKILLTSTSGQLRLRLSKSTQAGISARSVSGAIACDLPLTEANRAKNRLTGILGSDRGSIELKTVSGRISLGFLED